ncbi:MAG: hypothetical protein WCD42_09630, partial [Rhizomicrobium sp.]
PRVASLPKCTAEAKCNFRFEHDRATNTSRRVFIPPTEDERTALTAVVRNLEARLVPAPRGVCTAVLRGLSHMPVQRGTRDGADSWGNFFLQAECDLKGFSVSHLCEAVDEHRRTAKFYPTIADLWPICERLREGDACRLRRANLALNGPQPAPAEKSLLLANSDPQIARPRDFRAAYAALTAHRGPHACA